MKYSKLVPRETDDNMGGKKPIILRLEKDKPKNKILVPIKNRLDEI